MRVLLVEDNPNLAQSLCAALCAAHFSVDHMPDGEAADHVLLTQDYALVILDLGLPKLNGLEVLRRLRARRNPVPVLILTAHDSVEQRVRGLDLGADDYLVKPFESKELLARIRAVVRRKSGFASPTMGSGRVTLDMNARRLMFDGQADDLSAREYALMLALLERPGAILSRQQIEERLYGWGEEVESNAVDAVIYSVRRKFGQAVIRNVRGLGWAVCT